MERLRDGDHVDARLGKREILGRAVERLAPGQNLLELRAHLRQRLDGDDAGARRNEQPRQLARAGAEVDHGSARAERARSAIHATASAG